MTKPIAAANAAAMLEYLDRHGATCRAVAGFPGWYEAIWRDAEGKHRIAEQVRGTNPSSALAEGIRDRAERGARS